MLKVTKIELVFVCLLLLHWVSVAAGGLSLAGVSGGCSCGEVCGLLPTAISLVAEHGLSSFGSQALQHRLHGFGRWAQ